MYDLLEAFGEESISFPPRQAQHDPDHFYIASDTTVTVVETPETLREAVYLFTEGVQGQAALYLIRGGEVLATYNGGQSEPHYEIIYHVTKDALPEWLDTLSDLG